MTDPATPLRVVQGGKSSAAPPPVDDRPTIHVIAADLDRMVREGIEAIAKDPDIYQRSGELVTITQELDGPKSAQPVRTGRDVSLVPGTPRIRTLTLAGMRVRAAKAANWVKYSQKAEGDVPCAPDANAVAGMLDASARGGWPADVRPIRGIRECPFLAPSGRIVTEPGYDNETGFVLVPSVDPEIDAEGNRKPIPERPTQDEARAALRYLWTELLVDFPYVGLGESENSRDNKIAAARFERACTVPDAFVAIEAMLTTIARPAIRGAIVSDAFEANTQGAGKSLQAHVISMVTVGRPAGTSAYPTSRDGHTNDEEMSKTLGAFARAGVPIVTFDNVRGEIGGGALEGAMTAVDSAPFRLLGTQDLVQMPWSAKILFSGNNMVMSNDVAQRILMSRLDSQREDPRARNPAEFRRYPMSLLDWASANRARLVRACLVILRAAHVARESGAQMPDAGSIGSFEAWSKIVPAAIAYAGGPKIISARPKLESLSGESAAHSALMRYWPVNSYPEGTRLASLIKDTFQDERAIDRNEKPDDGLGDFRAAVRELTNTSEGLVPSASELGKAIFGLRGKWCAGRKLTTWTDRRMNVQVWTVEAREQPKLPGVDAISDKDPAEEWER